MSSESVSFRSELRSLRGRRCALASWLVLLCLGGCEVSFSCGSEAAGAAPSAPAPPAAAPANESPTQALSATERAPELAAVEVPPLRGRVNDDAKLLTAAEVSALEAKLKAHERATQQQFALLIQQKLPGVSAEDYGFTVANHWKLGGQGRDDGLLVLIAVEDRAMNINVGRGLERVVPDELAARVIAEQLTPAFREKRYAAGLGAAFDRLIAAAASTPR